MSNDKGKAQQARQSDAGRMARRLYSQKPEVRVHRAALKQIKKNLGMRPVKRH